MFALGLFVALPQFAQSADKADKPNKDNPKAVAKAEKAHAAPSSAITPEREAVALAFARQNHPELGSLLEGLKQNAPREYQAAINDVSRSVEKLDKTKERSPERHEFELIEWKMTSRIRLLAARLTMSSDPAVEAELKAALRERLDARLASQRKERDRLKVRIDKLDQQIDEMSSASEAIIEKQFADLKKAMPPVRQPARAKAKKPTTDDAKNG
jgi:cell division protein FtsB